MQPFEFERHRVDFFSLTGEVIGSQKRSETRVYGGGGGGTNGNAAPVSIGSTVTVVQEFFLKRPDGDEAAISLRGVDALLRDGQTVTMISARLDGAEQGHWVRLVNRDTKGVFTVLSPGEIFDAWKMWPAWKTVAIFVAIWFGPNLFLGMFGDAVPGTLTGLVRIAAWGYAIYWAVKRRKAHKRILTAFGAHCDELARSVLSSVQAPADAMQAKNTARQRA
jgi:hypothetical protein